MAKAPDSGGAAGEALWKGLGLPLDGLPPQRLRLFERLARLAHQAHGERAADWFRSPQPALGGVLPLTLLRDPANGPRLVEQALSNALNGPLR